MFVDCTWIVMPPIWYVDGVYCTILSAIFAPNYVLLLLSFIGYTTFYPATFYPATFYPTTFYPTTFYPAIFESTTFYPYPKTSYDILPRAILNSKCTDIPITFLSILLDLSIHHLNRSHRHITQSNQSLLRLKHTINYL